MGACLLRILQYLLYDIRLYIIVYVSVSITSCIYDTAGAIRLRNNSFTLESGPAGRLEIYVPMYDRDFQNPFPLESDIEYQWVSICAPDRIDQSAADVACRQLGYEKAYDYGGAVGLG